MLETVRVRGIDYPVKNFSDLHLRVINEMFSQKPGGVYEIGGFVSQCNAAEVVKEVILPDLPDDVISVTARNKYIWQLSAVELPFLLLQIIRVYRLRRSPELTQPEEIQENQDSLTSICAFIEASAPESMRPDSVLNSDEEGLGQPLIGAQVPHESTAE